MTTAVMGPATTRPCRDLSGRIRPPGDKSISHRAVLLGALAEGETRVSGLLESDDVLRTVAAVTALGAGVEHTADGGLRIHGAGERGLRAPKGPLDFGNSGTGCRLTMGAVAGQPIEVHFTGDESLRSRPMERILAPLRAMGAGAWCENDRLPAKIVGHRPLKPLTWISPKASAQVKSAVLLAGLSADGLVEVIEPSRSRDHTERMLIQFGVEVETESDGSSHWTRIEGPLLLEAAYVGVPGDPSSAAFLTAAAVLVEGSELLLDDVLVNPTRTGFIETLHEMGADVRLLGEPRVGGGEPSSGVEARASSLKGVDVPAERAASMIDEYPILAVCAAFAEGETVMRGINELRVKESNRIATTAAMLQANGVTVRELNDGMVVEGRGPGGVEGGGHVKTHGDHRIAMSAMVLGLAARNPVSIDDVSMIATSYPGFFDDLRALGAGVDGAAS
jgi:3-phosphoshikimate 1-carboxyvinyltransferase